MLTFEEKRVAVPIKEKLPIALPFSKSVVLLELLTAAQFGHSGHLT